MIQCQTQEFIIAFIANTQSLRMRVLRPRMVPLPRTNTAATVPNPAERALIRHILFVPIFLPAQFAVLQLTREA